MPVTLDVEYAEPLGNVPESILQDRLNSRLPDHVIEVVGDGSIIRSTVDAGGLTQSDTEAALEEIENTLLDEGVVTLFERPAITTITRRTN